MVNKKPKRFVSRILNYIIFIIVSVFLVNGVIEFTYATNQVPNVTVDIEKDQNGKIQITQTGDLYSNELWYPGRAVSGIIRINNNNVTPCVIEGLGTKVNMTTNSGVVYNSFLNNMKLTIEKGSLLSFGGEPLVNEKSLSDISKIKLEDTEQFIITKGNPIDLKYTLLMDMNSGDELEDVSATVNFLINVSGDEASAEVRWLPPIANQKYDLKDVKNLPIKFQLIDEDGSVVTEPRNIGLKIVTMVGDEEEVIASSSLGEGKESIRLNGNHYMVNFEARDYQFEPNITYTAYVYDVDTGEKLLDTISFTVDTVSATSRNKEAI